MSKNIEHIIDNLNDLDKEVLLNIYKYRCLNRDILYKYFYGPNGKTNDYVGYKIRSFDKAGLLQFSYYEKKKRAIFLTAKAISTLQLSLKLPEELFNFYNKKTAFGLYSAAELKMKQKLLKHQLSLAEFSIALQKGVLKDVPSFFYNDKYSVLRYLDIHPDGILCVPDVDMFLENDMGTERRKALEDKWKLYAQFIHSGPFALKEAEICVLFILQNKNPDVRRKLVLETLLPIWNDIGKSIEVFIGCPEQLTESVTDCILPKFVAKTDDAHGLVETFNRQGFSVYKGRSIADLTGESFDFYISKLDENKKVISNGGEAVEYFIDLYFGQPVSVLKKISMIESINSIYLEKTGRRLKYVVVGVDKARFIEDVEMVGVNSRTLPRVFFTTEKQLKENDFNKAIELLR